MLSLILFILPGGSQNISILKSEITIEGVSFDLLFSGDEIEKKIREMGEAFAARSGEKLYTMVPVMTGALYFSARFLSYLDFPYRVFSVSAESYDGLTSTGEVNIYFPKDLTWLEGADVIILEYIVETGLTIRRLESFFYAHGAQSVSVITLFYKPERLQYDCPVREYGFSIGDEFIVGYGMDYHEQGRWLQAVYQRTS